MTNEKRLWQRVIEQALLDAHWTGNERDKNGRVVANVTYRNQADSWLRNGGKDFNEVCDHAGIDADFLRKSYIAGRINMLAFKSAESASRMEAAE